MLSVGCFVCCGADGERRTVRRGGKLQELVRKGQLLNIKPLTPGSINARGIELIDYIKSAARLAAATSVFAVTAGSILCIRGSLRISPRLNAIY